jgi:hypothetical protein
MDTAKLLDEVENEIARLTKVAELLRGDTSTSPNKRGKGKGKRTMSAAGRKKIAAAQRKRWAKIHAEKKSA